MFPFSLTRTNLLNNQTGIFIEVLFKQCSPTLKNKGWCWGWGLMRARSSKPLRRGVRGLLKGPWKIFILDALWCILRRFMAIYPKTFFEQTFLRF